MKSKSKVASATAMLTNAYRMYKNHETPIKRVATRLRAATSSSRTRTRTQSRPKRGFNMGAIAPSINYIHGKSMKLNSKFVAKVKEASSNVNSQGFQNAKAYAYGSNSAFYSASHTLYNSYEIGVLQTNINTSNPNTTKYLIREANLRVEVTNQSSGSCNLQVYECQARHDFPLSPVNNPITLLGSGFTDAGRPGDISSIVANPFGSTAFVEAYKITNVKTVLLNPGQTMRFVIIDKSPLNINMARWKIGSSATIGCLAKRSRFLLFKQWGQVVDDSVNKLQVGTDSTKLDFAYYLKYDYSWSSDVNTSNNGAIPGFIGDGSNPSFGSVTLPEYINENTSGVQTEQTG